MENQNSLEELEKTLDPVTVKYLNAKYRLNDEESQNKQKMDLRIMCESVENELKKMEHEAAIDYLKVENDTLELMTELEKNDSILGELEEMLLNFKENLSGIKQEMTVLQEKSLKMNIALNNRKSLSSSFENFIKNVVLEPKLIDDIIEKPIDENYVGFIDKLCQKLNFIKKYNLGATLAVREIEPELAKLKLKASERIKIFLIEKIDDLKKPKTNIEVLQKNILGNFKNFLVFLKEHYQTVFIELCNHYSETLSKIYQGYLKDYINTMNKLIQDAFSKNDFILSDNQQMMREIGKTLHSTIYALGQRDSVLHNLDEPPVVATVVQKKNQKLLVEVAFKSINKLLIDTVAIEFTFSMSFFNLNNEQTKVIFGGIFKSTLITIIDNFKNMFSNSHDAFGLLLIAILNERNKKAFNSKGYNILDQYFDQINMLIWPRFEHLYEHNISSLRTLNPKALKLIEKNFGYKAIYARYADFTLTLYKLYSFAGESHMLKYRILGLKNVMVEVIKKMAKEENTEFETTVYFICVLDMITTAYQESQSVFEEDIVFFEKEQKIYIDSIVKLYLRDFYHNLYEFVLNNTSTEDLSAMMNSGDDVGDKGGFNYDQSTHKIKNANVNLKLIENINVELNENWQKKIDKFKTECNSKFGSTKAYKKVATSFLKGFFTFYKYFFYYVKENHMNYTSSMTPLHTFMNTIKNEIKKFEYQLTLLLI